MKLVNYFKQRHTPQSNLRGRRKKRRGEGRKVQKWKGEGVPVLRASVFFVLPNNFPNSSNDVNCQYATDHK